MATTSGCGRWDRTSSTAVSLPARVTADFPAGRSPPEKLPPWPRFGTEQKWPTLGCCPDPGPGGISVQAGFQINSQAASFLRAHVAKGTVVHDGEAALEQPMSVSRSRESIIRRHTTSLALALTWLRSTSPGSAAPRPAPVPGSRSGIATETSREAAPASKRAATRGFQLLPATS